MNLLDLLINLYCFLYNRKFLPVRVLSPLRYTIRCVANRFLPTYLAQPQTCKTTQRALFSKASLNKKIIVSFSSYPKRIDIVWMVVECMLRQTLMPDAIILYLSKEQFKSDNSVPISLLRIQNDIFKIKFVDNDYRSHKKYLYAFEDFPNDIVITIDDDIFYPTTMIESLIRQYLQTPDSIVCRYSTKVKHDENGKILPYVNWKDSYDFKENDFFGSGGGTLFIPQKLYKDVTNINLAMKLCPLADDIWLNAMARLNGVPVVPIMRSIFLPINSPFYESLCKLNIGQDLNDNQIRNVVEYYKKDIFGRK